MDVKPFADFSKLDIILIFILILVIKRIFLRSRYKL